MYFYVMCFSIEDFKQSVYMTYAYSIVWAYFVSAFIYLTAANILVVSAHYNHIIWI